MSLNRAESPSGVVTTRTTGIYTFLITALSINPLICSRLWNSTAWTWRRLSNLLFLGGWLSADGIRLSQHTSKLLQCSEDEGSVSKCGILHALSAVSQPRPEAGLDYWQDVGQQSTVGKSKHIHACCFLGAADHMKAEHLWSGRAMWAQQGCLKANGVSHRDRLTGYLHELIVVFFLGCFYWTVVACCSDSHRWVSDPREQDVVPPDGFLLDHVSRHRKYIKRQEMNRTGTHFDIVVSFKVL